MQDATTSSSKYWLVTFDGDDEQWVDWKVKLEAIGRKKGWWDVLTNEDIVIDRESVEAVEMENVRLNDEAFMYLTIACEKQAFKYVSNNENSARKSWKDLTKRYDQVSERDLVGLHKQFGECKLKSKYDDPKFWFDEIERLRKKITEAGGQEKTDAEVIAHILIMAPKEEYGEITRSLRVNERTQDLTEVKRTYQEFWKDYILTEGNSESKTGEAYHTEEAGGKKPWKRFKGTCNNCGKQGHKKVDCWELHPEKKKGGKPKGQEKRKCFNCNEIGHIAKNCPKKESAADAFFVGCVEKANGGDEAIDQKNNAGKPKGKEKEKWCPLCIEIGHTAKSCPKEDSEADAHFVGCVDKVHGDKEEVDQEDKADTEEVDEEEEEKEVEQEELEEEEEEEEVETKEKHLEEVHHVETVDIEEQEEMTISELTKEVAALMSSKGKEAEVATTGMAIQSDETMFVGTAKEIEDRLEQMEAELGVLHGKQVAEHGWRSQEAISEFDQEIIWHQEAVRREQIQAENRNRASKKQKRETEKKIPAEKEKKEEKQATEEEKKQKKKSAKTGSCKGEMDRTSEDQDKDEDDDPDSEWIYVCEVVTNAEDNQENNWTLVQGREKKTESWLIDSGATIHVTNDKAGLTEVEPTKNKVKVGNGNELQAEAKGTLVLKSTSEGEQRIKLTEVHYVPEFTKNVISADRLMEQDVTFNWNREELQLRNKNGQSFTIPKIKGQ